MIKTVNKKGSKSQLLYLTNSLGFNKPAVKDGANSSRFQLHNQYLPPSLNFVLAESFLCFFYTLKCLPIPLAVKLDFMVMAKTLGMAERAAQNSVQKFAGLIHEIEQWIDTSFMPDKDKQMYKDVVLKNAGKLEL